MAESTRNHLPDGVGLDSFDPKEELAAMFFTQLSPSSACPVRFQPRSLVHQVLVH